MRTYSVVSLLLLVGLPKLAAGQSVAAPVLGYAIDPAARAIRPIGGVPGAAAFEAALATHPALARAVLAPGADYALASAVETGRVVVLTWEAGAVSAAELALAGDLGAAAFSPGGRTAAMYSPESGSVQVWLGLPRQPLMAWEARIGRPAALAVSDDGLALAAILGETGSQMLAVLTPSAGPRVVAEGGAWSALAFAPGRRDLAVAQAGRNQVSLITDLTGEARVRIVAGVGDGIANPVALAFSADGTKLAAASDEARSVVLIDLETRAVVSVACEAKINALERVRGNAVFRLTRAAGERSPLFDGDAPEPRIVFIAAGEQVPGREQ